MLASLVKRKSPWVRPIVSCGRIGCSAPRLPSGFSSWIGNASDLPGGGFIASANSAFQINLEKAMVVDLAFQLEAP